MALVELAGIIIALGVAIWYWRNRQKQASEDRIMRDHLKRIENKKNRE